jgi:hypothetical protein
VDLRKGSIFGGSAFISYGAFWWSVFALLYVQPNAGLKAGPNEQFCFFFVWTLFTLAFCIASIRVGRLLSVLVSLASAVGFCTARRRCARDRVRAGSRLENLRRGPPRLVCRHGDIGKHGLWPGGAAVS